MKYAITTLGCKVNQYETQAIETLLNERGHEVTDGGDAGVVIVNTCAVTAESGRKSRQAVRRLKAQNPGALTVVCGCFSQISPEDVKALGADIVFGSGERVKLVEEIERLCSEACGEHEAVMNIDDPMQRLKFELLPAGAVSGRTRASLKVQDGCDNFCAYCIIPYARGRVRSLPPGDAARQARELAEAGYKELVITGIEIASYGKDLAGGETLCDLVETLATAAPGLRLRLGSLEPRIVTEDFCRRLSALGCVCPHFHLSLQSGCDETLRRMGRKYDTVLYLKAAELLRQNFPGCAIAADLIVGFPGESEEMHQATIGFLEKCGLSFMHIFPYSVRPGTRAASMEGQVSKDEKARRVREAQEVADVLQDRYLRSCVGKVLPVLFEHSEDGVSTGHADNYCQVQVSQNIERGLVRNVQISGVFGEMLVGEVI